METFNKIKYNNVEYDVIDFLRYILPTDNRWSLSTCKFVVDYIVMCNENPSDLETLLHYNKTIYEFESIEDLFKWMKYKNYSFNEKLYESQMFYDFQHKNSSDSLRPTIKESLLVKHKNVFILFINSPTLVGTNLS